MSELITFDLFGTKVELPTIEYKNRLVLLPQQLSNLLDITLHNLNVNFRNHIDEFVIEEDYFVLESEELAQFKSYFKSVTESIQSDEGCFIAFVNNLLRINKLYLWTEGGVANHAKISDSPNSWKLFKILKKFYFGYRDSISNSNSQLQQYTHSRALTVDEDSVIKLRCNLEAYSLFNVPRHIAEQECVKRVKKETGIDYTEILKVSPSQLEVQPKEVMLEPTELAQALGLKNGAEANKLLASLGLQIKVGNSWKQTEVGKEFSTLHSWTKNNKNGYNLRWNIDNIKSLLTKDKTHV